jgi:hypothetical protein
MILWDSSLVLAPSHPSLPYDGDLANDPVPSVNASISATVNILSPTTSQSPHTSNESDDNYNSALGDTGDGEYDNDSALGDLNDGDSTSTLDSRFCDYVEENGRTYHSYQEGKMYFMPNDETEQDRLDFQHGLFLLTFQNRLHICPYVNKSGRVLEIGTGTGVWAIGFADRHAGSIVTAVDLSPIQPIYTAPNAIFQVDDVEMQWTYTEGFDFIYSRMMAGGIKEWPHLMAQSFE